MDGLATGIVMVPPLPALVLRLRTTADAVYLTMTIPLLPLPPVLPEPSE